MSVVFFGEIIVFICNLYEGIFLGFEYFVIIYDIRVVFFWEVGIFVYNL